MLLRWFEHSQVYHPDRTLVMTGAELGRPFEEVRFRTGNGLELHGWFYPTYSHSPRAQWALLLCHGNAGNISHRLDMVGAFLETGVNVFLFDYQGFGQSQGRPSEQGTYEDAQAAYEWLARKGFTGRRIIAFGESLGGAVAAELATHVPLGGLVIEASFSCTADVGAELFPWLPVRWLSTIKYDTCAKLPRIRIPVLIMHSRGDRLIGFHHAERNFSVANQPKLFCELEGDHNEPLLARKKFVDGLEQLLVLAQNQIAEPLAI